jgi:peptide/nickel transport system substrate-binding protein
MNDVKTLSKRTVLVTVCLLLVFSPFYVAPTAVNAQAEFDPRYGGTLRVAFKWDIQSFNGMVHYWHSNMQKAVFSHLATYDNLYNVVGDALKSWSVDEEPGYPSVYTVVLEDNIRFSDGQPLTSEDVKFTFETTAFSAMNKPGIPAEINDRLASPAYRNWHFANLDKIEIVDEVTTKFYFTEVQLETWMVEYAGSFHVYPKHLWEDYNKNNPPGSTWEVNPQNEKPVGSGAFMVEEYERDQYTILKRNPDHFRGVPYLENVVWSIIPDRMTAVIAMENGEIDAINEALFPYSEYPRMLEDPRFTVAKVLLPNTWRVRMNMHPDAVATWPWLDREDPDARAVRYAMEYAIDKEALVNQVLSGVTEPSYTTYDSTMSPWTGEKNTVEAGYTGDWPLELRYYDKQKAIDLLEGAGWKVNPATGIRQKTIDGKVHKLEFKMSYYDYAYAEAEAVAEFWEEVNIACTPDPVESVTFWEDIEASWEGLNNENLGGPWPCSLNSMSPGPDPDRVTLWMESRTGPPPSNDNFGFYSNPQVDALIAAGRSTTKYSERKQYYDELQYHVHMDQGFIYLYNRWRIEAWSSDFGGFECHRPAMEYGFFFRGNQTAANPEDGVYWRGGTETPFPETPMTTVMTQMTTMVTTMVPEFMNLQLLAAFALFLLVGLFVYRRHKGRRENE